MWEIGYLPDIRFWKCRRDICAKLFFGFFQYFPVLMWRIGYQINFQSSFFLFCFTNLPSLISSPMTMGWGRRSRFFSLFFCKLQLYFSTNKVFRNWWKILCSTLLPVSWMIEYVYQIDIKWLWGLYVFKMLCPLRSNSERSL